MSVELRWKEDEVGDVCLEYKDTAAEEAGLVWSTGWTTVPFVKWPETERVNRPASSLTST